MNEYMNCPLHWLVSTDDFYRHVQSRLKDSNERDIMGYTLLHVAAQSPVNNSKSVQLLLDRGADVNSTTPNGQTPLHFAVSSQNHDTVVALIEAGASVNSKDLLGRTPLQFAVSNRNHDTTDALIEAGAFVNSKDFLGRTPLHFAVSSRNRDTVVALIEAGASINTKDFLGRTALHLAVCKGKCYSLIYDLGKECDMWIVERLLCHPEITVNLVDHIGETPLVCAVKEQSSNVVKALLKKGANPNIPNIFGQTALHKALSTQSPYINIVLELLKYGAGIYWEDNARQTPVDILLHKALDKQEIFFAVRCLWSIALRYQVRECLRSKWEEVPCLSYYLDQCCREVAIMKRLVIYDNVTLHDFALGIFRERVEGPAMLNYLPVVEVLVSGLILKYFEIIFCRLSAAQLREVLVKMAESSSVLVQIPPNASNKTLYYKLCDLYKRNSKLSSRIQRLKHLLTNSSYYQVPLDAQNETKHYDICNFYVQNCELIEKLKNLLLK